MSRASRCVAVALASIVLSTPALSPAPAAADLADPTTWSARQLAAQLVFAGVDMADLTAAESWSRAGVGGIVLFGTPPADLKRRLARVRSAGTVRPFVASDEEGGRVQRLTRRIYALPSAEWMGRHRTPAQVRAMAAAYGKRMRALNVDVDLAPVADLGVRGQWMERQDRAFAADPGRVSRYVDAWQRGMRAAHVAPVVKHWPGHGQARDTHVGLASTPRLSTLESRDMIPFRAAFRAGVPVVMVGHLQVPGLTEAGRPASLSPRALRYLRRQAGPRTLIITDSLSMGAIRTSLGLSTSAAALRSLQAGADMAMIDGAGPTRTIDTITRAIRSGTYSRARAVASVQRILAVKRTTTPR